MSFYKIAALAVFIPFAASAPAIARAPRYSNTCRSLPGDANYPSVEDWKSLNSSIGGRLIQGVPLAQICYGGGRNSTACSDLKRDWALVDPFLDQPVSVVPPYFENNTCTPFVTAANDSLSSCRLGNLATYAINVSDAETAAAGIKFARDNNLRLSIKNTGHDYLGGSTGKGSLALWTHHLTDISLVENYQSDYYTGPAFKIGAGVQFGSLQQIASDNGLRVVGGSCPTVGANGGWRQGGGHGPLSSTYGLGADNSLEYEVVTADGQQLTASPKENSDLFWALSGGGAGNYALVISAVIKAHKDGPIAGAKFTINNNGDASFWTVVEEWMKHLLVLDGITNFASEVLITPQIFSVEVATLPDGDESAIQQALAPFYETVAKLNITPIVNTTDVQSKYVDHYNEYLGGTVFTRNITIGGRLIPRSLVQNRTLLPALTQVLKDAVAEPDIVIFLLGYNVTTKAADIPDDYDSVTPAWRDSLFLVNLVIAGRPDDPWPKLQNDLARANQWQDKFRELTPGGGAYINEGTFDAPQWKDDYFGGTYDRLRAIKAKYDPNFIFYVRPGAGADEWAERADGHLCKVV